MNPSQIIALVILLVAAFCSILFGLYKFKVLPLKKKNVSKEKKANKKESKKKQDAKNKPEEKSKEPENKPEEKKPNFTQEDLYGSIFSSLQQRNTQEKQKTEQNNPTEKPAEKAEVKEDNPTARESYFQEETKPVFDPFAPPPPMQPIHKRQDPFGLNTHKAQNSATTSQKPLKTFSENTDLFSSISLDNPFLANKREQIKANQSKLLAEIERLSPELRAIVVLDILNKHRH